MEKKGDRHMEKERRMFRTLYHRTAVIDAEPFREDIIHFPGHEEADRLLVYGYVDHERGLTLEVLACGIYRGENQYSFFGSNNDESVRLRAETLGELDIEPVNGDLSLYQEKIGSLQIYDDSEELKTSREMAFLDPLRDPFYPDDIQVLLRKKGL